jgi:hypothetical protein
VIGQLILFISGVLAIFLTQDPRAEYRRWACIVGLAGQPFWLASTFAWSTWGMFCLSVLYTCAWLRGLWVHWLSPRHRRHRDEL